MKVFGFRINITTTGAKKWRVVPVVSVKVADERMEATLPELLTPKEYGEEARSDPMLLKPFGKGRRAAWANRDVLEKRFIRQKQWIGTGPTKTLWAIKLAAIVFSLPAPAALTWAYDYWYLSTDLYEATVSLPVFFSFASALGVFGFSAGGWVVAHLIKYNFCYTTLVAFEQKASMYDRLHQKQRQLARVRRANVFTDEVEDGRQSMISGRLQMKVPWLAFVDQAHRGSYYAGARSKAGVQSSEIHVQMPPTLKIHDLVDPEEVYAYAPRRHEFTGNTALYWYQFLQMFVSIGEKLYAEKQTGKLRKFLQDYWIYILIVVEIIGVFYLNSSAGTFTLELAELVQESAQISEELNQSSSGTTP